MPAPQYFFTGWLEQTPPSLRQLVRHAGVPYERVILVMVIIERVPTTSEDERLELKELDAGLIALWCALDSCR